MLGQGGTVPILPFILLIFASRSARCRRRTFSYLLSVLIVAVVSKEEVGEEEEILLRLTVI